MGRKNPAWGGCLALFFGLSLAGGEFSWGQVLRAQPGLAPLEDSESAPVAQPTREGASADTADASGAGTYGLENVRGGTGQAYGETPVGIGYSSIFKNTNGPLGSIGLPAQVGAEVSTGMAAGKFTASLPLAHVGLPFLQRGFPPERAHLKLGPVYVHFGYLSGEMLASDNIYLSEDHRESGYIGALRLGTTIIAQLTEGLQFAAAGTLTYLPFTGDVGFGVGQRTPLLLGLVYEPIVASQLTYETMMAGWDVTFSDDLRLSRGRYQNYGRDDFYLFDSSPNQYQDRAGRYWFVAPETTLGSTETNRASRNRDLGEVTYLNNIAGVKTERILPGQLRFSARLAHENLWYYYGGAEGLPATRDMATLVLESQRENLRFKPFIAYEGMKTNLMDGMNHTFYMGFHGPITDQLQFFGKLGWLCAGQGSDSLLWSLQLNHLAGPYTTQSLAYERGLSEFHEQIQESLTYRLEQILGPKIRGTFFAGVMRSEWGSGGYLSRDDFRSGLLFSYNVSPKTDLLLGGIYTKIRSASEKAASGLGDWETWTGRFDIRHKITDTLTADLLYQYQKRDSGNGGFSYYENLVYLMLSKTFE